VAVDSSHLYWADAGPTETVPGTIMKANLDGTGATAIASDPNHPAWVAVDSSNIYWSNLAGTIMEANLDGTGATAIATDPVFPQGVAVGPQ